MEIEAGKTYNMPGWLLENEYRIKPAPKPNMITWHPVFQDGVISQCWPHRIQAEGVGTAYILRIEINHNDPASPVLVSATLEKP